MTKKEAISVILSDKDVRKALRATNGANTTKEDVMKVTTIGELRKALAEWPDATKLEAYVSKKGAYERHYLEVVGPYEGELDMLAEGVSTYTSMVLHPDI